MFGKHLLNIAKTSRVIHGTIQSGNIKQLPKSEYNTNAFKILFTPKHVFTYTTTGALLDGPNNPLFHYQLKLWEAKTAPLWHSFVVTKDAGKMKVVKTTLQKRVRIAFWKALENRGYARDGTRLPNTDSLLPSDAPLVGTVQFIIAKACLKTKGSDLQRQMDEMLENIIHQQNHTSGRKAERKAKIRNR
jgi:hypothetical protein